MKKLVLISYFVLYSLLLISLASAVEIQLSKEVYLPGETLQAEIYGVFIDSLRLEDIGFYRERNIPMEYDLLKLSDKYLLYAVLPLKEGDYSLKIKDVSYETDTGISYSDIVREFKVEKLNSTNETFLSFNPGFIVTKEDFFVNLESNKNLEVEATFLGEKQNLYLVGGKKQKAYFSIEDVINYTETSVEIHGYSIPVIVFPKTTQIIIQNPKLRFSPLELGANLLKEEVYSFTVALVNYGSKNLTNIGLSSDMSDVVVEINPEIIPELGEGKKQFIDLTFLSEKEGNFSGKIFASAENLSAELEIRIQVTENESEIIEMPGDNTGYIEEEGCEESGGKFCSAGERCSVPLELTIDGYCCTGECTVEGESDGSWILGVIIIIGVLVGIVLLAMYTKKKQKKPMDALKQREEDYTQRMKGEEVRGSLSKS